MKITQPDWDKWQWFNQLSNGRYTKDMYVGNEPRNIIEVNNYLFYETYYGTVHIVSDTVISADIRLDKTVSMYFMPNDNLYIHYIPTNGMLDHYEWASDDKTYFSEHNHKARYEHDLEREKVYKYIEALGTRKDVASQKCYETAKRIVEKYDKEHRLTWK